MRSPPARSAGRAANAQNNSVAVRAGPVCGCSPGLHCLARASAWYAGAMSRARGHSLERRLCLGLAALSVCFGCGSSFSANEGGSAGATGVSGASTRAGSANSGGAPAGGTASSGAPSGGVADGGGFGGGHAGSSGSPMGRSGAPNGGAGGAQAGAGGKPGAQAGAGGVPTGVGGKPGAGAGGTSGSSGAIGHGGKPAVCAIPECLVANTCLDKCGGAVVYTGCCQCEPPSVNKLTCPGTN